MKSAWRDTGIHAKEMWMAGTQLSEQADNFWRDAESPPHYDANAAAPAFRHADANDFQFRSEIAKQHIR